MKHIIVDIDQQMLDRARTRWLAHPDSKRKVFRNSNHTFNGYVGEEVFQKAFPEALTTQFLRTSDLYNYDFLLDKKRIEVKTKTSKVEPIPDYYDCSVLEYLKEHQKPDFYVHIRNVEENGVYVRGHILGIISADKFYNGTCFTVNKGDILANTGRKAEATSFNCFVSDLNHFQHRYVK